MMAVAKRRAAKPNAVGRRVKALREGKFTQAELAQTVGVHKLTISRLETSSDFNPSLELIQRLAGALGVSVADLVSQVPPISQFDSEDESE
jgi:transcriptional regulator with XRE-family HTH domain